MPRIKVEKALASFKSLAKPESEIAQQILQKRTLPLTADNAEDLKKLQEFVQETSIEGQPSKLAQEFAQKAKPGAAARVEAGGMDVTKTDKIPTSSLVQKTANALGYPQKKLLGAIGSQLGLKKEKDPSEQSADIAENVANKLGIPEAGLPGILARTGLATATEFGLDPLNLIGLPAKGVSKLVQKAPGVLGHGKQAAEASMDAVARKLRANQAAQVLSTIRPKSTAEKLAEKGAEIIVPRGSIIRSRP